MIDAIQGRDVATIDIPNAFVQTEVKELIIVILRGDLCKQVVKLYPSKYKDYVLQDKKGNPYVYTKLNRALYGIMQAALLFYEKLTKDMLEFGFTINPYDVCVANKIINKKQLTAI